MKICKVEFIKTKNDNINRYTYPQGYDPEKINVINYDDNALVEGDNISYCVGVVTDDFLFTDKMVEVTKEQAQTDIYKRAILLPEDKIEKYIESRNRFIIDAGL